MKEQVQALREIHTAVDLGNRIESLKLFAAADAIYDMLINELEGSDHIKADYMAEKLGLFISYFSYAVMPANGTAHPPAGWLREAGHNLKKVEIDLGVA